ncbi:MAG: tetrahydrofolate synthase [Flavobacteriales bacterium]|nr:tetrahydrofolate synthase [Flavobacteriales bacterium]
MNYKQTIDYLFKKLPSYQNIGKSAYKKDIGNIKIASEKLGNPHLNFKSVHVAGTNGKGSVSHMIASIMQEAGYKVGLYTSPHLKDFRERIKINGKKISKREVIEFIADNKKKFEDLELSFFEMTVALSFYYFNKMNVDIAIIETGLGGRLDSTNIISPEISIITNISLDHTNLLGNSIQKIAKEKAGIIKSKTPVIIGDKDIKTVKIFNEIAELKNAKISYAKQHYYRTDLKGIYQKMNVNTCVSAIHELKNIGWEISKKNIEDGLLNCIKNTELRGRWEIISKVPLTICDTAHNLDAMKYVVKQINQQKYLKLHFVFGTSEDKDLVKIIKILPKEAIYYICKPNVERGLDTDVLSKYFTDMNMKFHSYENSIVALKTAKKNANKKDLIIISGSTFLVAELI